MQCVLGRKLGRGDLCNPLQMEAERKEKLQHVYATELGVFTDIFQMNWEIQHATSYAEVSRFVGAFEFKRHVKI